MKDISNTIKTAGFLPAVFSWRDEMLKEWIKKIKELFSDTEEEERDPKELPAESAHLPVPVQIPRRPARPMSELPRRIVIFVPAGSSAEKKIADCLKQGCAVIVNYTSLDAASAKHIFRFLSGFIFASGGECRQISKEIFLYSTIPRTPSHAGSAPRFPRR